jgi:hypothetical protein
LGTGQRVGGRSFGCCLVLSLLVGAALALQLIKYCKVEGEGGRHMLLRVCLDSYRNRYQACDPDTRIYLCALIKVENEKYAIT